MQITRRSPISGQINTMEIAVTEQQIRDWQHGAGLIQDLMPNLTSDEREFLMTGITPEEWNRYFRDDEE